MTKFSVVFIHKLKNAGKKQRENVRKKPRLEAKERRAKLNDKFKKTFVAVFAEYEFDCTT